MAAIRFFVNGECFSVADDVDPSTSLAEFLRLRTKFKGTKIGCSEGGCGACAVQVLEYDAEADEVASKTINSCLCPVGTLHNKAITTVEGIGNSKQGFHALQESFAKKFASQCGYCTPGFIVASHHALERAADRGQRATAEQLQQSLDGNLCRCTGYRPILDACKAVADGYDIEELTHCSPQPGKSCSDCPHLQNRKDGLCASLKSLEPLPACLPIHCSGSKRWYAPKSLAHLLQLMDRYAAERPHLLAGNTGAGVYKYWPTGPVVLDVKEVVEFKAVKWTQDGLELGAAVTIAQLIELLHQPAVLNKEAAKVIARHLHRVAGTHVRYAATLGGHMALAHSRSLESDLCTLLLALEAQVCLASRSRQRWVDLHTFLSPAHPQLSHSEVVAAVKVPLPGPADYYWSHKVALRYYNCHALVNLALWKRAEGGVTVAMGHPVRNDAGQLTWRASRLDGMGTLVGGGPLSPVDLVTALSTLKEQLGPASGTKQLEYANHTAEALLFMALVPLLDPVALSANPSFATLVKGVEPLPVPRPVQASHSLPVYDDESAPLHQPVVKDNVLLQASGEAHFMSDAMGSFGQLYAAYVTSSEPLAAIDEVDPSVALAAGAVAFFGAADVPGINQGYDLPLFADKVTTYVGQPIGMVLAHSAREAEAASKLVRISYSMPPELGTPIISLDEAIKAGSFFDLGLAENHVGDVEAALRASPFKITNARYTVPSQQHFYMETQCATAVAGEDDIMTVYCGTQSLDAVQLVVSRVLGIPFNKVNAVCSRIGGAFGGKSTRQMPIAAAAALAASKTGRKVQFMLNRNEDFRQNAGRCPGFMDYNVGFTDRGVVTAVDMKVVLQAGQYLDIADADVVLLAAGADIAYNFPNMRVSVALAKCNTTPRTIMRAPGFLQACLFTDQIMENVAAYLGLDAVEVKARNFIPESPSRSLSIAVSRDAAPFRTTHTHTHATPLVKPPCHSGLPTGAPPQGHEHMLQLPLGRPLKASLYTMPRIWSRLQSAGQYKARKAAVQEFNQQHAWRKKGLVMTPCRFDAQTLGQIASVSVFCDGSVLLTCSGIEMGQGLSTKLKQMASWALGQVLPKGQGPLPMDLIRVNVGSSFVVPGGGPTWGSTGSESACQAVRVACEQLVENLRPIMQDKGSTLSSWRSTLTSAMDAPGITASTVQLSAVGFWSGNGGDGNPVLYSAFGAALTEVVIDLLTGERSVEQVDILYDCGHSLNPMVDLGQMEGAFVMGMGMMLEEEVVTDPMDGRLLTDSTWTYKIPTVACIPRNFNISFLEDSPNPVGIMSSKAVGEPGVMLSSSTIIAMQQAASTAQDQLASLLPGKFTPRLAGSPQGTAFAPLAAPATPPNLRLALGDFWVGDVLAATLASDAAKRDVGKKGVDGGVIEQGAVLSPAKGDESEQGDRFLFQQGAGLSPANRGDTGSEELSEDGWVVVDG